MVVFVFCYVFVVDFMELFVCICLDELFWCKNIFESIWYFDELDNMFVELVYYSDFYLYFLSYIIEVEGRFYFNECCWFVVNILCDKWW